jgi:hypothetical protein
MPMKQPQKVNFMLTWMISLFPGDFLVIPEGLYRRPNDLQERPGFPLRSAAGMTLFDPGYLCWSAS